MRASPTASTRTWAFVIAAAILYIPANLYPVLTVIQLGAGAAQHHPGRRRGAARLADVSAGAAGVLRQRPGAAVQAGRARRHVADHVAGPDSAPPLLRERTRLYYIVAWIGRWSMVDIFMESLLGALVQFGTRRHHRTRHRRRRLLRRRPHHHFRRRSLRSAAHVGRRRPQRPPPLPSGRAYPGTAGAPALS